jgi:DNA repair photolyase
MGRADRTVVERGRGAVTNPAGRFEGRQLVAEDDGWGSLDDLPRRAETVIAPDRPRHAITRNDSPDVPFDQSINPYQGCEHGCIYCYARPSHAFLDLSPGIDFETRLFAKPQAAELLRAELSKPGYRCDPIALGANTDPYQPIEREWKITRQILEVLAEHKHPVSIVTKSALVERDLDVLTQLARDDLVQVFVSITTLDGELARKMEPRAASPRRRLQAIQTLNEAGVPCGVMAAPVIPFLTDAELEKILEAAHQHGARSAGYTLLRLPYELKELFKDWLVTNYPLKAKHVMGRIREMRGGRENDPEFGSRFRGSGLFADLLAQRFRKACERFGFNLEHRALNTDLYNPPSRNGQLDLF